MLECEILLLAIGSDIPKIRSNSPDIVARAQLRGLILTLAEKVVEAKALIKLRRQENRRQLTDAEVDNKWIPFSSSIFIDFELGVLTEWIALTPLPTRNQTKFVDFFLFAHLVSCGIHFVDPNNAVTLTERLSVASVIVYDPKVLNLESITNTSSGESAFENFMLYWFQCPGYSACACTSCAFRECWENECMRMH